MSGKKYTACQVLTIVERPFVYYMNRSFGEVCDAEEGWVDCPEYVFGDEPATGELARRLVGETPREGLCVNIQWATTLCWKQKYAGKNLLVYFYTKPQLWHRGTHTFGAVLYSFINIISFNFLKSTCCVTMYK